LSLGSASPRKDLPFDIHSHHSSGLVAECVPAGAVKYMGCWADERGERAMEAGYATAGGMSNEVRCRQNDPKPQPRTGGQIGSNSEGASKSHMFEILDRAEFRSWHGGF